VPLDFTAIDFETANSSSASACAVGLTRVRNGRVVATAGWLIQPPPGHDRFFELNVNIHGITADDVVVVTSAAGGLGTLLLQGARNAGARVVGLASGDKLAVVRRFGAHTAVDRRDPDWPDVLRAVEPRLTVLLDGVGGDLPRALHAMLEPGGRTVRFSGDREGYDEAEREVVDVLGPAITSRLSELEKDALEAAADGSRVPFVGTVHPLADAALAHEELEAGRAVGKVVLAVGR